MMERDTFLSDNGSALLNKPFRLHPLLRIRSSLRDSTSRVASVLSLPSFKIKKIPARINPTTRETLRNSQKISTRRLESQGFKLRLPTSSTISRLYRKDFKRSIPAGIVFSPTPINFQPRHVAKVGSRFSPPRIFSGHWSAGRCRRSITGTRLSWTGYTRSTGRTAKMPRPTINYPRGSVARALNLT